MGRRRGELWVYGRRAASSSQYIVLKGAGMQSIKTICAWFEVLTDRIRHYQRDQSLLSPLSE
jgi:hypothetical protein